MSSKNTAKENLLEQFTMVLERDRKKSDFPDWMTSWSYQEWLTVKRGSADMDTGNFSGSGDINQWFDFTASGISTVGYIAADLLAPLVQRSLDFDKSFLGAHDLSHDYKCLLKVATYNAEDYLFQNFYAVPKRHKIKRILDFGGGYGRQINLWSGHEGLETFIMIDAIPQSYCMQSIYCRYSELQFNEYIDSDTVEAIGSSPKPAIHHLPTWRLDLLPDNFVDAVTCVQVLTELSPNLCLYAIGQFARVLKPGGMLYIRDHGVQFSPNNIALDAVLPTFGFVLEFRPVVSDKIDIHGIPKIWRKIYPEAILSMG